MLKARQTGVMITIQVGLLFLEALPEHLPILCIKEVPAAVLVEGGWFGVPDVAIAPSHDLRSDSGRREELHDLVHDTFFSKLHEDVRGWGAWVRAPCWALGRCPRR